MIQSNEELKEYKEKRFSNLVKFGLFSGIYLSFIDFINLDFKNTFNLATKLITIFIRPISLVIIVSLFAWITNMFITKVKENKFGKFFSVKPNQTQFTFKLACLIFLILPFLFLNSLIVRSFFVIPIICYF